jgi:hypothetical protein
MIIINLAHTKPFMHAEGNKLGIEGGRQVAKTINQVDINLRILLEARNCV